MVKHTYRLYLNSYEDAETCAMKYDYGSVKDVTIRIGKTGAMISFSTAKPKDLGAILQVTDRLVQDAIRKALVCCSLYSGTPIALQAMVVLVDGDPTPHVYIPPKEGHPFIYCLLDRLERPIASSWQSPAVFHTICSSTKTTEKEDSRFSALYSLLSSKAKQYEIERFANLWTSMNSLYSFAAQKASPLLPPTAKGKIRTLPTEDDKLRFFAMLNGFRFDDFISNDRVAAVLRESELQLAKYREWGPDGFACAMAAIARRLGESGLLPMDEEAFVLFWFAYKLRCKYFHGEQPALFFCYADDYLLRCLSFVSDRLESFLDRELPRWLADEHYMDETIRELAPCFHTKSEMQNRSGKN